MKTVRPTACESCPYRRDVPSGVWHREEYEKLRNNDKPTVEQPLALFNCHAALALLCHGWAVVHGEELLALRLVSAKQGAAIEIPSASVPMFQSGAEACAHGLRDTKKPSRRAVRVVARLLERYQRLRQTNGIE